MSSRRFQTFKAAVRETAQSDATRETVILSGLEDGNPSSSRHRLSLALAEGRHLRNSQERCDQ